MLVDQPFRWRGGGSAHHHFKTGIGQGSNGIIQPGKIIFPGVGFQSRPGKLAYAHIG